VAHAQGFLCSKHSGLLKLWVLGLLIAVIGAEAAQAQRAVFLVRHAEKASQTEKDPALSLAGEDRALDLTTFLRHTPVDAIFVTHLKRTQATLEELNRDLEVRVQTRNAELQQAMGQLVQSEKLAALGSLVAGVAHELNTPIGNVMAVATTLTDEVAAFSQKLLSGSARRSDVEKAATRLQEASALIERNATKAAKLINDFKEVAVDQSSTRRRHFVLLDVVNEVLTTTRPLFKNAPHTVAQDIPLELTLDSYPGPLEQVLTNFLTNSLNHGFEGQAQGQIHIQARQEGSDIVLEYSDNGCGIAAANLQHVFEPFYTTKLGRGGSGLGLYIVYNLVSNVLGGSIAAHSTVGVGTRFVLHVPIQAPSHSAPAPL
jgi:signal transduction histidine kinase